MEKDRKTRIIAIIALCISILGLSIGFAAFSEELNINFSDSNVSPSGDLDIRFLASNNKDDTSTMIKGKGLSGHEIVPSMGHTYITEDNTVTSSSVILSSDGTTLSGMSANFYNDDQAVRYDIYIYNNSEYNAFLKSIEFLNYMNSGSHVVCTAVEGTNQSLVDDACRSIGILIYSGDVSAEDDGEFLDNTVLVMNSEDSFFSFENTVIEKGAVAKFEIYIVYVGEIVNEEYFGFKGSPLLPNGDFKVNFGDVKFNFSSIDR